MSKQGRTTLSNQLRRLIDASGQSRYAICKAIGLDQATLSRFMAGTGGLSVESLDKLGQYLRLELRPVQTSERTAKPAGKR